MKKLVTLFFIGLTNIFFSQNFKQGTIILETGEKKEGLIDYVNKFNTPQSFEFKDNKDSKSIVYQINNISKVEIPNYVKFVKREIDISYHSNDLDRLDDFSKFQLTKKIKMVEILEEGKYNLYKYEDANVEMYYYSEGESLQLSNLLYKKYYQNSNNEKYLVEDKQYISEINKINCNNINIDRIQYNQSSLTNIFNKINTCNGSRIENKIDNKSFIENKAKLFINSIKDSKTKSYSIGYEWEETFPYFNNSFSVSFSPEYMIYEKQSNQNFHYKNSVELPLILKYYFFKNKDIKAFLGYSIINLSFSKIYYDYEKINDTMFSVFYNNYFEGGIKIKKIEVFSKYYYDLIGGTGSKSYGIGLKYNFYTKK